MKFGLTSEQYQYIQETVAEPLSVLGAKLWCFGSRARGDHTEFSDLDLFVEGGSNEIKSLLSQIAESLEEENFPFKVDLVLKQDLAESYSDQIHQDKKQF